MKTFDTMWEKVHREQEWGRYPSEEIIRFVARNYSNVEKRSCKILDFGCGAGAVAWYLAKEKFDTYGFDGSKTAIEKAKKRMSEEGVNVNLLIADASNTPYDDNYFDAIIDSAVIYGNKVEDIKNILKEARRVLKVGGKIFSTGLFNIKTSGYGTGTALEKNTYRDLTEGPLKHKGTIHFFTDINEVQQIWTEAGLRIVKIDSLERTDMGGLYNIGYYMVEAEK